MTNLNTGHFNFEQFDRENTEHQAAAVKLAEWSWQSRSMLLISQTKLETCYYSLLGYSDGRTLLGHIAVTKFEDGEATVGGLVVNPDERKQGVGLSLIKYLLATVKTAVPDMERCVAYANDRSVSLFYRAGGKGLGTRDVERNGCAWIVGLTTAVQGMYE